MCGTAEIVPACRMHTGVRSAVEHATLTVGYADIKGVRTLDSSKRRHVTQRRLWTEPQASQVATVL